MNLQQTNYHLLSGISSLVLEILVRGFIFSVIAVPILVLFLSGILYFKFPKQRENIGVIFTSLGSVELFLYMRFHKKLVWSLWVLCYVLMPISYLEKMIKLVKF